MDNKYWIISSGIDDETIIALYSFTNCYPHLLKKDGTVNRTEDGKVFGLKYSLDSSKVIVKHDIDAPKGQLPNYVKNLLNSISLDGPFHQEELKNYINNNKEEWIEKVDLSFLNS